MRTTLPVELSRLLDAPDDESQRAAWEEFVEIHSLLLLNAAGSRGGGYDVVMDRYAFVLDRLRDEDFMWLKSYALSPRTSFRTWLAVVACRLCTDHHWSQYRRGNGAESEWTLAQNAARQRMADAVVGESATLNSSERLQRLNPALERLSHRDRCLLAMRFETDASESEIAAVMAFRSSRHVRQRLRYVQSALQRDLQRPNASTTPA